MAEGLTISVVTPCFNSVRHLKETIQSVLAQDYPRVEYLVMDGGSTDGTIELLRSYGDRIRWFSEADRGQADAINKGFERTSGEVLAWLNADDTYAPGALGAAAAFMSEHPETAMVYGDANFIDASGQLIGPCAHVEPFNCRRLFLYSDFIVQPSAFFRRTAFQEAEGLDPSLNWTLDYDLWLKLAKRCSISYLPRVLANYRWLGESKTASGGWARLDEIRAVLRRHGYSAPAYVCLECVNAHLQDAVAALRARQPLSTLSSAAEAAATLFSSPRAMRSLLSPRTWKIIYTGQVLRRSGEGDGKRGTEARRHEGTK